MPVQTIVDRVQALFEDFAGSVVDKDYVMRYIPIVNEDLESELESLDLSYDTDVVVISQVPAGTSDLSAYQAEGSLLANMVYPISLEWRQVGEDDTKWRPVSRGDKVTDEQDPSTVQGISSYEWRKSTIFISASSEEVDIRVRCAVLPEAIDSDSAGYIKGMTNVIAFRTAAMICAIRGGAVSKQAPQFQLWGDNALDKITDRLVKQEQNVSRTMAGRRAGNSALRWRLPTA